jgi:RNA polymerase sigma-70 factor (ECF subfamily)
MGSRGNSSERLAESYGQFITTHWSGVLKAGRTGTPQASAALEELCQAYWQPLYAHVRRRGYPPEDAQDLTQEFFARLLGKQWLGMADARRGRFRSFLLAALNHFLANEWDRAHCAKRGGGQKCLCWDTAGAEELYLRDNPGLSADALYERNWALGLLEQARSRLRAEYLRRPVPFDVLERFLPGEEAPATYAQAAAQIRIPEGTLKSDVHRFKQRYARLLREEIARTVPDPEEVEDELRYLKAVLGR